MFIPYGWKRVSLRKLKMEERGFVTFDDNKQGKINGISKVDKEHLSTIDNALFVDGLFHNLFGVSQLRDTGLKLIFELLYLNEERQNSFYWFKI